MKFFARDPHKATVFQSNIRHTNKARSVHTAPYWVLHLPFYLKL